MTRPNLRAVPDQPAEPVLLPYDSGAMPSARAFVLRMASLFGVATLRASIAIACTLRGHRSGGIYLGYDADTDAMRRSCLRCGLAFLETDDA